jgi:hypothetical protein
MSAAAVDREPLVTLVDLGLEDLRQDRVPAGGPDRDVDPACDLDVSPVDEPEIDAVEQGR